MTIKGTSVKSTYNFVKKIHPEQEQLWLDSLTPESKSLMGSPVMSTDWYSIMDGMIVPVQKIADLFYGGDVNKAAFEIGKYSAIEGLKGVYKIFIRMASPIFVLKRSPKIFNTYYSGVKFDIIETESNRAVFLVEGFKKNHESIFSRIDGWIEETLRIIGSEPLEVSHKTEYLENEKIIGTIIATWK